MAMTPQEFHQKLERIYDYLDMDEYYVLIHVVNMNKEKFRPSTVNQIKSIEEPLQYLQDKMLKQWCPKFDVQLNVIRTNITKLIRQSYAGTLFTTDNPILLAPIKANSIDLRKTHPLVR